MDRGKYGVRSLKSFLIRRMMTTIITLWIISLITFFIFQVIPGDPALLMLGPEADPQAITTLQEELGLHQPVYRRYLQWIALALQGDLGNSIRFNIPVKDLLWHRLPVTGSLAILATILALFISFPLGIWAALHRGTFKDYGTMIFAQLGISIPSFWIGIMLMLFFAVRMRIFSPGGFTPFSEGILLSLRSLLLPSVALGLQRGAILTRMVRSSMLESLNKEYIQTARSKGLQERVVIFKHALKNALIPIITVLGLHMASLLAGSIVIEEVFTLPGMGRLLLMAVSSRDFPMVQGLVLFISMVVVLMNFFVDILYSLLDPRIIVE